IRTGQKIWIPTESESDTDEDMADEDMAESMDVAEEATDDAMSAEDAQALTDAGGQLAIAVTHFTLLADSLATDDLLMAQSHAEHVVNILDGEDGRTFGDANRDGNTQNPGDGVGVRGYLAQVGDADVTTAQELTSAAMASALQLFAVDTTAEAMAIADELGAQLDQLGAALNDSDAHTMTHDETMSDAMSDAMDDADDKGGLLARAAEQTALAQGHSGFLADELTADGLDAAKNHAEHVINILDGEDGLFFGDNNRDGRTQNPGDGTGVRSYLEQALEQLQAGEADANAPLAETLAQSLGLVESSSAAALTLFAVDTVADAQPISAELTASLDELSTMIASMQTLDEEMAAAAETTAADAVSEDLLNALVNAQTQTDLAAAHYAFLQDSLGADDLVMALTHTEHVINILQGEDGLLFGDNNRDGNTQNPGDGIGVGPYLAQAAESTQNQALLDTLAESQQAAEESAASAVLLFTADTRADAQPLADDLGLLLTTLQESIATALASGAAAE
ncbi:MAG: hypothetical protein KDD78_05410, partial [Caldilineaceae bacterium]|nr:hypothetical protein [Caldilineaceae bacterium]